MKSVVTVRPGPYTPTVGPRRPSPVVGDTIMLASIEPTYSWTEVLSDWWIGAIALAVSLVITPVVRAIAYRSKIVDRPDDLLKPHGRPIAYLGGVGICIGLLAGLLAYGFSMSDGAREWQGMVESLQTRAWASLMANRVWHLFGIGLSCVAIVVVGLLDDIKGLTPSQKILGQVIAAGILLAGGVGIRMADLGLTLVPLELPAWLVVLISGAMCLVLVICTTNATNLLDGLDGLAGGVTGIIALGFLALAVHMAMYEEHFTLLGRDIDMRLRVGLCLAMAGGLLGFLPYNVPPASIFMGDAGSMLLGFFVATMMAMFCEEGTAKWLVAALAVFALPILDTALAVVRRALGGKSIFSGDRSHLYDQLVDRGMSVRQVVGLFYLLAAVASVIGVLVAIYLRLRWALLIYAALLVAIWVTFILAGMVTPESRRKASRGDLSE